MPDFRLEDFDYQLPPELIAQSPAEPRDRARLMVLSRDGGRLEHAVFRDLPDYLDPADCLVLNDTRVVPARLFGRLPGGGRVEVLVVNRVGPGCWEALVRPGRRVRPGAVLRFPGDGEEALEATVLDRTPEGGRLLAFGNDRTVIDWLNRYGRLPLPPYIHTAPADPERYQTVFARVRGSVAAPTAGLHFTEELLDRLRHKGVTVTHITLHVGPGTFLPMRTADPRDHRVPPERYRVPEAAAQAIAAARSRVGKVVAVGTTVVRALETAAAADGTVRAGAGSTDLVIRPGYRFRVVEGLITNFHLPRSTLMMLVGAFMGDHERLRRAYATAVAERYRFYSFGDAMLIL